MAAVGLASYQSYVTATVDLIGVSRALFGQRSAVSSFKEAVRAQCAAVGISDVLSSDVTVLSTVALNMTSSDVATAGCSLQASQEGIRVDFVVRISDGTSSTADTVSTALK